MQNILENHNDTTVITAQRKSLNSHKPLWEQLNLCQQFSVSSLGQFGYILTSVSFVNDTVLAVLKLENKIATINAEGAINIKSTPFYH